jgi:hypothetical protein
LLFELGAAATTFVVILSLVLVVVLVLVLECISNILAKTSVSFSIKMAASAAGLTPDT